MSSEAKEGQGPSLRGMGVEAHLASPAIRQRYVTTMFEIIAPKYDRFTRAFSFGLDRQWKADLIEALGQHIRRDARVVDLACGTGNLTVAMTQLAPEGSVLGIDASPTMVACARTATGATWTRTRTGPAPPEDHSEISRRQRSHHRTHDDDQLLAP